MNRIYRLVFNRELRVMQVASELAGSRGGGASRLAGAARRSRLAASVLAACVSFGAVSGAWAQTADRAAIFDDDYVMSPDTAANYDWSQIRTWGMIIGYEEDGHVIVRDSLLVESAGVVLGSNAGVTGQMDLIGPNTTLTEGIWSGEPLYVGFAGTGLLNVLDGAKVVDVHWLYVAEEAGSKGTVNVDGAGSEAGHFEHAVVGRRGDGQLNITNGGQVSVGNIDAAGVSLGVGQYEGATGTVLVDGEGSLLQIVGNHSRIGDGGTGALTVSGGGKVTSESSLRVGYGSTGEGSIEVTGAGSSITTGGLHVGYGSGHVAVRDGGRIESDEKGDISTWLNLGVTEGGTGSMLVEGAGTTLDAKGNSARIGSGGRGELTIRDGASAALGTVVIGSSEGSSGSLLVTGAGTTLTTGDDAWVYVGNEGNGDLRVLDGAEASVGNLVVGASPTDDEEDQDPSGNALVSGAGTVMNVAGEVIVADNQSGSLVVENGAALKAGSLRFEHEEDGDSSRVAGELHIRGAGTTVETTGAFVAGEHFSLTDGARLETGSAEIDITSYTTAPGDKAIISGSDTVWNNAGELVVSTAADITEGAQVSTGTVLLRGSSANASTGEPLYSQLRILGEGSRLTTTGDLTLGAGFTSTPGYLVLADDGQLQTGGEIRLAGGGGLAFGTVHGYAEDGTQAIADPQAPGALNADARLVFTEFAGTDNLVFNHTSDNLVLANTMLSEGYATGRRSGGGITSLAGTTRLTGDLGQFTSRINVTGGKLVLDADVNARPENYDLDNDRREIQAVDVSGGTLVVNRGFGFEMSSSANNTTYGGTSDFSIHAQGTLGGAGRIFGKVEAFDGGHIAPGDGNAATLAIEGDLIFGKSGQDDTTAFYDVDIRGNGTSDKLAVSGTANLDENGVATTVNVTALDPGTSYQDGQQYTILTAGGGVEGTFDKVLSNSAFLTPTLTYDANNVMLGVALNTSKADAVVGDGEVLSGNGDWASIQVQGGGTLSPGTSGERIGTISATGAVTFAAGSFYDVDIRGTVAAPATATATAAANSDLLTTTGQATLDGGTVRVTALDPQTSYQDGHGYTIVSADGGVSGEFEQVLSRSAFLDPSLAYDDTTVKLVIALKSDGGGDDDDDDDDDDDGNELPPPIFETVATTRNQYAIAGALSHLPQQGDALALYNTLLMLSADQARAAYGSLSGESHLATRSALLGDRFLRDGIERRLAGELPELAGDGITAWVAGAASSGRIDSDDNAARSSNRHTGLMAGVDWALTDTLVLGAALGSDDREVQVPAWGSSADVDGRHLGLYASARWDALSVRGGISHAWYDVDSRRRAVVGGALADRLDAGYDASATTVFAEGGWDLEFGRTVLTPYLALAHTRLETDGAVEQGGITALEVAGSKDELLTATAGVRASWSIGGASEDDVRLQAGLAYQNASGELKPDQRARFVSGSDVFAVYGAPLARDMAVADLALSMQTSETSDLWMGVQGRFSDNQSEGGAQLQWHWRF